MVDFIEEISEEIIQKIEVATSPPWIFSDVCDIYQWAKFHLYHLWFKSYIVSNFEHSKTGLKSYVVCWILQRTT